MFTGPKTMLSQLTNVKETRGWWRKLKGRVGILIFFLHSGVCRNSF